MARISDELLEDLIVVAVIIGAGLVILIAFGKLGLLG